ncbi:MAG TPA: DUF2752 domain-containing protein [Thermogutta sp.]|nr:DUF2752 domain-containing protein [Thermogutta sp.]HQF12996.1 DUF2752 domain-containing protein [Thermogutta sp.]
MRLRTVLRQTSSAQPCDMCSPHYPGDEIRVTARWPWTQRLEIGALGLGLAGLLFVARWLQPAAEGFGTHQQLGLPPCTMVVVFGKRCPTCGITTAWAYWTRGKVREALSSSVSGTLLAVLAMVMAPWLIISAYRGQWAWWAPKPGTVTLAFVVLWIGLLCEWLVRLWCN